MTQDVDQSVRKLEDTLAVYIHVLGDAAARIHRAEDGPRQQAHLAAAAMMFSALRRDRPIEAAKALVAAERYSVGWGYLSGEAGSQAEAAFHRFALLVEAQ
jgi:hypothetical protein